MITIPTVRPLMARSPTADYFTATNIMSSGTWGGSSTAYIQWTDAPKLTVDWWDGTSTTYTGTYRAISNTYDTYISKAIASPYNNSNEKTATIYTVNSSGQRGFGKITSIQFSAVSLAAHARCKSVNLKNLPFLTRLVMTGQIPLTSLDLSNLKNLGNITIGAGESLTSINVTNCTNLNSIDVGSNATLNTITGLSTLQNLYSFSALNCSAFTSLDFSNLLNLRNLYLYGCSNLTSLRAQNCLFEGGTISFSYYYYGTNEALNVGFCNLDATALNQLYTDLAVTTSGFINVKGNPGTAFDDPTIATNKNYTVLGS